ncbi:MAG: hypothetical protein AAF409_14975 [Pseudomonadota bacterium]
MLKLVCIAGLLLIAACAKPQPVAKRPLPVSLEVRETLELLTPEAITKHGKTRDRVFRGKRMHFTRGRTKYLALDQGPPDVYGWIVVFDPPPQGTMEERIAFARSTIDNDTECSVLDVGDDVIIAEGRRQAAMNHQFLIFVPTTCP